MRRGRFDVPLFAAALLVLAITPRTSHAIAQGHDATPIANPLSGVAVERLTDTPPLPFRPRETTAALARYTFEPDGRVEHPYPGPVLVYVESGTLTIEGVAAFFSILNPRTEIVRGTSEPGEEASFEQIGEAPPEGADAEIPAGGSAYAADGVLGVMRNAADAPLVLLVVAFATYETWGETGTAIAEEP